MNRQGIVTTRPKAHGHRFRTTSTNDVERGKRTGENQHKAKGRYSCFQNAVALRTGTAGALKAEDWQDADLKTIIDS